jgi:alpha-beta hydrolase superfamily lysophospholipase
MGPAVAPREFPVTARLVRRAEVTVDVTDAAGRGERLRTAVTVTWPSPRPDRKLPGRPLAHRPLVLVAWPGGGYNRRYFDLRLPGRTGYSQAEHHARHGIITVACDHLGTGDSSVPVSALGHAALARANAATASAVLTRLRDGTIADGLAPLPGLVAIGAGHSYGGLLLTMLQAAQPAFSAVAMLGWSGVSTVIPVDHDDPLVADVHRTRVPGLRHPYRRAFHYDDVPEAIVALDLDGYPGRLDGAPQPAWAARFQPGGPNVAPERPPDGDITASEAARIDVPVLIAMGERDVCPDPWAEPGAYRGSRDVTLVIVPAMGHAHNFASSRAVLWDRIVAWARTVEEAA